jgi:hypothetical protein
MRIVLLVLTCAFLAGCPPYLKIYVHNNSDNTIHVESRRAQNEVTTIRAGRAKTIPNSSLENVCFELSVGSDVRIYSSRLDFHFGDDVMYVRSNTGERLEIFVQAQCVE